MDIPMLKDGRAGRTDVDVSFLGDKVLKKTLRNAVIMYEANKRVGTHSTIGRSEVARSKKALFPQKHTGRARVRHPQVTQCRGGGVPHGPKPRDYSYSMPRKALRAALRSALLSKFQDGEAAVVDGFRLQAPKTREVAKALREIKCDASCLIVVDKADPNLVLSVRNLPRVAVAAAADLNAYDVVFYRNLVVTEPALAKLKEIHSHA